MRNKYIKFEEILQTQLKCTQKGNQKNINAAQSLQFKGKSNLFEKIESFHMESS